ncbi:hypothetical protein SARC_09918 [Sphaeroforma arctica JP610]|uniref:Uncharacterized protein n=1 Tax=Sphaeroforma arctica JP610 TaxID=667725 RepID=A0A0L0FLK0_9EUKA|nr:hypothetical protein SARC_09918 [Sphaeroforma arctica JP610]KNC77625.1 hypothetical protein SARC_09918 [Sphaeroforma arctica JP610]|eukprot:XP_014151527.1 hypothetical protein SARC_09918 [Sphaeroforma arctica JP610]
MSGEGTERCTLPRVLSILLVTSSSRGQNLVFRYPPEPGHEQWPPLSQRHKSNKAAHGATSAGGDRNITAKSSIGNVNAGTATSAGASGRKRGKRSAGGRSITTNDAEGNIHNASDAPVSAFLMPRPMSEEKISRGQHNGNGPNTLSGSHASTSDAGGGSGSSGHHHHSGGGNGGGASFGPLFGYSSEFLASMLSPEAILCDQPFIVKIDDLVFQGYPSLLPQSRGHGLAAAGSPTGTRL